jgi:hypothetical protein
MIACLKDIVMALQNPSPQSPLALLTDTHNKVLRDITQLLTNAVQPPLLAPTPPDSPDSTTNSIAKPPSVLRVDSPSTSEPTPAPATEQPAPLLRVPNPTAVVRFDPSTKPPAPTTNELTYVDVTGIKGKQRRKSHRKKTKVFPTIATAKTVLAKIKKINPPPQTRLQSNPCQNRPTGWYYYSQRQTTMTSQHQSTPRQRSGPSPNHSRRPIPKVPTPK